jgi:hypothetical protein
MNDGEIARKLDEKAIVMPRILRGFKLAFPFDLIRARPCAPDCPRLVEIIDFLPEGPDSAEIFRLDDGIFTFGNFCATGLGIEGIAHWLSEFENVHCEVHRIREL